MIEERFWRKVEIGAPSDCWAWRAGSFKDGYGAFRYNGKHRRASHVALILSGTTIPDGMCVLHRCDNPSCVNPDHLFLGTVRDNHIDMIAKGRNAVGVRNGNARLNDVAVCVIRHLLAEGAVPTRLAVIYGVSLQLISAIRRGLVWKSVPGPTSPPRRYGRRSRGSGW